MKFLVFRVQLQLHHPLCSNRQLAVCKVIDGTKRKLYLQSHSSIWHLLKKCENNFLVENKRKKIWTLLLVLPKFENNKLLKSLFY